MLRVAVGALLLLASAPVAAGPTSQYVVVPGDGGAGPDVGGGPTVFYLNHGGGTFRPGSEDARANRSSILDRPASIEPWQVSRERWDGIVGCVRGLLARWDVEVTDEDPGDEPHYELVIGGKPDDLALPDNYAGVAPFNSKCRVIPNAIVFTFAERIGRDDRAICETAAQEIAHAFGLDHEYLCSDPMSYLDGCGAKSFQPVDAPCGERDPRACRCGAETQSSVAMLDARLGLAGEGNPPPAVAIAEPAADAVVAPGFAVTADAADNAGVAWVELRVDGVRVATAVGAPFAFATPAELADGVHTLEVVAVDDGGASASHAITVTVARQHKDVDDEAAADPVGQALGCAAGGGRGGAGAALLIAVAGLLARPSTRARRLVPRRRARLRVTGF